MRLRLLLIAMLLAAIVAGGAPPERTRGQAATACAVTRRGPEANSIVAGRFPMSPITVSIEMLCTEPATFVIARLDERQFGSEFTLSSAQPPRYGGSATLLARDVTPGVHNVYIAGRTASSNFIETWTFRFAGVNRCGIATPNGGGYPAAGAVMVVWEAPAPCSPAAVAASIGTTSGKAVTALWSLDGPTGEWRYYVGAAGGTLADLPTLTAVVAILG